MLRKAHITISTVCGEMEDVPCLLHGWQVVSAFIGDAELPRYVLVQMLTDGRQDGEAELSRQEEMIREKIACDLDNGDLEAGWWLTTTEQRQEHFERGCDMTDATNTNEPWVFDPENSGMSGEWCWQIRTECGGTPIYVECSNRYNRDQTHEDIARLIAAAPEMYEALKDALAELSHLMQAYRHEHYEEICGKISAAIAKAEVQS